ncbi:hypothetical protein BP6252_09914 [Coleophoma cylindrospora]|uniref:Phosphatidylinositol-specific phospholipase C X domain-containing protein n=1 Tax=Coleophoma cylindrospora TaxID=1849047 RepID=A0A3D8QWZ2_9HELO|nr:hypothetical protein BP6252_09914 [Coleophoma cylindrospora]
MAPLSIRNFTKTPIELKLLERFESPQSLDNGGGLSSITRSFTTLMSNITTSPTSPQLAAKSESFSHQDVSILVGSFETKPTDIQPNPQEILRLTFQVEGERYRVDTPTPSQRSTVLTPLSPNPSFELTAVYLPNGSFLAIYSSAKLESWMSKLSNEIPISRLSIPGTHNSPTCHTALPSVRCQAVSVKEQLNNGVRFLDIRVQPENPDNPTKDGLILVHSAFPISLTGNKYLRDLINVVLGFLDANPSETVIISLKREGVGKTTDAQVSKILHDHYATDPARWFTENRLPKLGEVRNKIVIIRRFGLDASLNGGNGWCIDAESWPDNCADGVCSSGEIRVQDFYEVEETHNIDKKINFSEAQLARSAEIIAPPPSEVNATEVAKMPIWINFLSASNFFRPGCWPDKIAAKVNPRIIDFLCKKHNQTEPIAAFGAEQRPVGDGSTGIVVCDWVGEKGDWDLIRCIVGMNTRLEIRKQSL